jgi:signal transduction histidine kinase
MVRSLSTEREQRIRAQERAAVAAHLHDSVLQTLTLIQKRAGDPASTAALARHEERSLRQWLYGDAHEAAGVEGWREAAERMAGEVEDLHGVVVELVMVGDGEMTPAVAAVLAASREALVNAAKFSGATQLSMYSELTSGQLTVFVRDRGKGFEPALVDGDRRGIRDSIEGRLRSVGGTAEVRSSPGAGTEVALSLPLRDARWAS